MGQQGKPTATAGLGGKETSDYQGLGSNGMPASSLPPPVPFGWLSLVRSSSSEEDCLSPCQGRWGSPLLETVEGSIHPKKAKGGSELPRTLCWSVGLAPSSPEKGPASLCIKLALAPKSFWCSEFSVCDESGGGPREGGGGGFEG